jgi:hypothetical protein
MIDSNDAKWVLKIIRESCNLRGMDLEQAVHTIQKLQQIATTKELPDE